MGLNDVALQHIHTHAKSALGYSDTSSVKWVRGYEGRYAGCWEQGDWGSLSVWRLHALGFTVKPVTITARGYLTLWGRAGSSRYQVSLAKLREMFVA